MYREMGIYTTNYIYRTGMWELNYLRTGGEEGESEEYREMGIYTTNYIYRTGMWELNYLRTGGREESEEYREEQECGNLTI